jgi:hypothetical protein
LQISRCPSHDEIIRGVWLLAKESLIFTSYERRYKMQDVLVDGIKI